jgi:hypothetical protein
MAKQTGVISFTGPMGGISFYKSQGEYRAREKSGPSRRTVLTSPRFIRTRENAEEFRRAVRAATRLRYSLGRLIRNCKLGDSGVSGRLNGLFLKIIKSDPTGIRGKRTASCGELDMLETFEFHKENPLGKIAAIAPVSSINTASGAMQTTIRPFDPQQRIQAPQGATHFKILSVAAAIDFDKEQYLHHHTETGYLSLENDITETISLDHTLPTEKGKTLLLTMGVLFYVQAEEGIYKRIDGGGMRILQVSTCEAQAMDQPAPIPAIAVPIVTKPAKQHIKKETPELNPFTQIPALSREGKTPTWHRLTHGYPPADHFHIETMIKNDLVE